jgi:hypothetical protein
VTAARATVADDEACERAAVERRIERRIAAPHKAVRVLQRTEGAQTTSAINSGATGARYSEILPRRRRLAPRLARDLTECAAPGSSFAPRRARFRFRTGTRPQNALLPRRP